MKLTIRFKLNGKAVSAAITPEMTLLTVLKDVMLVNSVKRACVSGECGACTVIVDGKAMNACLILAMTIEDKNVETLENLGAPDRLHPLQKAFVEMGASQCGFCTPGFIMAAKAFLDENPDPTEEQIRVALSGNLCRCTGYVKPVKAVQQAIQEMKDIESGLTPVQAIQGAARIMQGHSAEELNIQIH
ncbi:MAG: aerobic-type carbon monoxide dehydrogenase, small subunit CoxS/CutS-like protein [Holophagaceae bacterium]|nr:aerobic-type carbon monoxide dehydrogenase, small subunit CoxS/CutS-like protein [Holophagaceae bacterium]